jgi:hypothetical protein
VVAGAIELFAFGPARKGAQDNRSVARARVSGTNDSIDAARRRRFMPVLVAAKQRPAPFSCSESRRAAIIARSAPRRIIA